MTIKQVITEGGLVESGLFNSRYLQTLVDQHLSGVRDHSTVLYAEEKIRKLMEEDPALKNTVDTLAAQLRAGSR